MAKPEEGVGICLHQLVAREEAVIKRVIAFSGSQGRNYYTTDMLAAQIIVVSDDTPVDFSAMNPEGSMIVRIAEQGNAAPYDVLMMRPLLVTRVMRTLDDACALLKEAVADPEPVETAEPAPVAEVAAVVDTDTVVAKVEELAEVVESEQESEPEPEVPVAEVITPEAADVVEPVEEEPEVTDIVEPESVESTVEVPAPVATVEFDADEGQQHRALVVDDSSAIRKQLELELRDAGISADFAEDGEQAMEKVQASQYDLIFLDIIMPGIDGYETCRQMRLRPEMKKTPIIMLSAKTSPLDEVQGVIAGASTYLTKPVKSEQLQTTLKRVSMWIDNFQEA